MESQVWKTTNSSATSLHMAAQYGHVEAIKALLESGARVNLPDNDGATPLHMAAQYGHVEAIKALLESGAKVNQPAKNGATPLHMAAQYGHVEAIKVLLKGGAEVNQQRSEMGFFMMPWHNDGATPLHMEYGNDSATPLHMAAQYGHVEAIKVLLESGAKVNQPAKNGATPLHMAAQHGHVEAIKVLLKGGAEVNQSAKNGATPLHMTAQYGHVEAIKVLLESRTRVNLPDNDGATPLHMEYGNDGATPLHMAAQHGHVEAIKVLLKGGAEVNQPAKNGATPLHMAAQYGHVEAIKVLLKGGAKVNQPAKNGATPLHMAAQYGHVEAIKALLKGGAEVNQPDKDGAMPLHMAAQYGHVEAIKVLLESGAAYPPADNGATPLHMAAQYGHVEAIKALLEVILWPEVRGILVNQPDNDVATSLHMAAKKGHVEAINVLLKGGAKVNKSAKNGATSLHMAAKKGHVEAIKALLEGGAKVNQPDKDGATPLHMAAQHGHVEAIKALLKGGAKVNQNQQRSDTGFFGFFIPWHNDGATPLHMAAQHGHVEAIKVLLKGGAEVNQPAKNGATPLHMAAQHGHVEAIKALLEGGAKVNQPDKDGATLLHMAAKKGHVETIKALLEGGAKVNQPDKDGITPLSILISTPNFLINKLDITTIKQFLSFLSQKEMETVLGKFKDMEVSSDNFNANSSPIYILIANSLFTQVREKQLQDKQTEQYFKTSQAKLHSGLSQLTTENALNNYVVKIKELIHTLVEKNHAVDDCTRLLENCAEPALLLNCPRGNVYFPFINKKADIYKPLIKVRNDINKYIQKYESNKDYKTICEYFRSIDTLYANYKKKVDDLYQETTLSKSERQQRVIELCQAPYMFSTSYNTQQAYLKEKAIKDLAPKQGETEVTRGENQYGTHIVRQCEDFHFKYHNINMPCYPAVEYMIGSLYSVLAGASYGIAPTELVKLHRPGRPDLPAYSQILIASQTVKGINLLDFLEHHVPPHPEYLERFDLYSFSAMVVTSLLSNPGDGKPDNYMVQFISSANTNNNSKDDFRIRLVGIDNDLAFANPIVKKHQGQREGQHFVEVKSVFYFFPHMKRPLDSDFAKKLIQFPAEQMLLEWIQLLQMQNQYYEELQKTGLLKSDEWETLQLPISFPRKETLVFIYQQLLKIQKLLREKQNLSHQALFEHLYPSVAKYYEEIAKLNQDKPNFILESITALIAASAPSLEQANIITSKRDKALMSHVAMNTMKESAYLNRNYPLREVVTEFIYSIDFNNLSSEMETLFLSELKGIKCLEKLTLRNCFSLTDTLLIALVGELSNLNTLYLIGCPQISATGIEAACTRKENQPRIQVGIFDCQKIGEEQYTHLEKNGVNMKQKQRFGDVFKGSENYWKEKGFEYNEVLQLELARSASLEDSKLNLKEQKEHLNSLDFGEVKDVPGDGFCLFHAVAHQIREKGINVNGITKDSGSITTKDIIELIDNYLQENWKNYQDSLIGNTEDEKYAHLLDQLERYLKLGNYAQNIGDLMPKMLSDALGVNIVIHDAITKQESSFNKSQHQLIRLGRINNNHYVVITNQPKKKERIEKNRQEIEKLKQTKISSTPQFSQQQQLNTTNSLLLKPYGEKTVPIGKDWKLKKVV